MNVQLVAGIYYSAPGEEITWAGICPWTERLCFGTESGHLYFLRDYEGQPPQAFGSVSEPVNGVAFSGDRVAVSSRSEIAVGRRRPGGELESEAAHFAFGAHGVLALPSGGFTAPLGTGGILLIGEENGKIAASVGVADGKRPNFYKVALLTEAGGSSVLAYAARDYGLFGMVVGAGRAETPISHEFPGIDVVDVCSLNSKDKPQAAVALNHDGSLLFFSDVLEKTTLPPIRFRYSCGVPYTVLSAQGHVFVLTSDEFVVVPDLAARFLRGDPMDKPTYTQRTPVPAVDAFLCGDDRVLLIKEEESIEYRVADLVGQVSDPAQRTLLTPTLSVPTWRTIQQQPMVFVPAA